MQIILGGGRQVPGRQALCRAISPRGVLDRRGATSAVLAGSASLLLGFTGLAVEAGSWYLVQRQAATAADLGAIAGAAARDRGEDYRAIALDTARRNGFASGVTAGPPASGAFVGDGAAVEVVVSRSQSISLARLFLAQAPTVRARAVATVRTDEEVCVLALGGGLELGGNSTTHGKRCVLAANALAPGGIGIVGSARVRAVGLITTGVCTGCASGDVWTDDTRSARPYVVTGRADPVTDPFARLQGWTPSAPSCRGRTPDFKSGPVRLSPDQATCTSLKVGPGEELILEPGLHYFARGADLEVQGRITGDGVTLVFTGEPDNVGTVRINAQAAGLLRGPANSLIPDLPEGAGLVLYRDARATNNGPAKEAQLNGGAGMTVFGGTYFPTSDVVVNGKSDLGSNCLSIVGWRLSFSGSADTEVDVSGCAGFTPFPTLRVVRLVE